MSNGRGVWGIDLGQCALKALRCTLAEDGETVVADAFDYIEYPKMLSQPDADPAAMIREALELFLSRNSTVGDRIVISVSGQSGLARFIKLPPVEQKKIPDIVKYEARQQIPFPLEDVIWDYQPMPGSSEDDGVAMELEVGIFAMKRDQVFRAIQPYDDALLELDAVQLTPLAIFNFAAHDLLGVSPGADFDPDNPPDSIIIVSMGTETTDLVITNGFRVWQRSVPVGGNHFTRALTKEFKLTFAKAEHLKRNAMQADDPKAVIQAMRPVYADLVTELQRSLNFFRNIDRHSRVGRVVLLGNGGKLPGLLKYLASNLEREVVKIEAYGRLAGPGVLGQPPFKENLASFTVCYGLCLQGLGMSQLTTSLLPQEILTARLIRRKKPWAVAALAALFLGLSLNFFFQYRHWYSVHDRVWGDSLRQVDMVQGESQGHIGTDEQLVAQLEHLTALGEAVVGNDEGRLLWLELLKAINDSLPRDPEIGPEVIPTVEERPFDQRPELHIEYLESEYFEDLAKWWTPEVQRTYAELHRGVGSGQRPPATSEPVEGEPMEGQPADGQVTEGGEAETPEIAGPFNPEEEDRSGWVIEVRGYHYFNRDPSNDGGTYVRRTLLRNLEEGTVELHDGTYKPDGTPNTTRFQMKELGISHPIMLRGIPGDGMDRSFRLPNPDYIPPEESGGTSGPPRGGPAGLGLTTEEDPSNPREFRVPKFTFTVQFVWRETPLSERLRKREIQRLEEQQRQLEAASGGLTAAE